jgi:hypothetical protein
VTPFIEHVDAVVDAIDRMTPEQAQRSEDRSHQHRFGTTDLAARGYQSYWD